MVPWATGDGIQLFSASAGVISFNMLTLQTMNVPKPNDVTLASSDSWFFTIEPDNLIQADTTSLAQFVENTTAGGQTYLTIGAFTTLPAFSIATGQANTISGMFSPKTPGPSVNVSFTRSKFTAMLNEIGPGATVASAGYFLEPLPGGTLSTGPFVPEQPQVISLTTTTDMTNEAIQYNNPYPVGWTLTERGEVSFGVPVALSGHAANTLYALVSTSRQAVVGGTAIVPLVGPAHAPTVDGVAFATGGTLATQPTIAWSAPTDGANMPDRYVVGVRALGVAGNGGTKFIFLANLATDTTSIKLPPGLLTAGATGTSYVFTIRSHYAAGARRTRRQPNADNFPRGIADVVERASSRSSRPAAGKAPTASTPAQSACIPSATSSIPPVTSSTPPVTSSVSPVTSSVSPVTSSVSPATSSIPPTISPVSPRISSRPPATSPVPSPFHPRRSGRDGRLRSLGLGGTACLRQAPARSRKRLATDQRQRGHLARSRVRWGPKPRRRRCPSRSRSH